jgi:hypothetical protein
MKKLIGILTALLVIYIIYFDLTEGTMPISETASVEVIAKKPAPARSAGYFTVKVGPGETVLSVVEHQLNHNLPVSIEKVIMDFKSLNGGLSPEKIQIGKSYRFPDYTGKITQ